MGLLQAALETYEDQKHLVGVIVDENTEPLTPLSHMIANAYLEVTITEKGEFYGAKRLDGEKTIIPVTEESANRTGDNNVAHPLSDQLRYLDPVGASKYEAFHKGLHEWTDSPYTHPKVKAIYSYIIKGTLLKDLREAGAIHPSKKGEIMKGKIKGIDNEKCMIRWRVLSDDENTSDCWKDKTLFTAYQNYYRTKKETSAKDLCMLTGQVEHIASFSPKGTVFYSNGAKLISASKNDWTYKGRFQNAGQVNAVGYEATQKAHAALRWLVSNHRVSIGNRVFLCWKLRGNDVQVPAMRMTMGVQKPKDLPNYQGDLFKTLAGYKMAIQPQERIVLAALEAATTGRLSVCYYNEMGGKDLLERIEYWYQTCCWDDKGNGPDLREIVRFAFGVEHSGLIEVDKKIEGQYVQQLLNCLVSSAPIPENILRVLVTRAGQPLCFGEKNRRYLQSTAFAVLRKYRNEKFKEEWDLALNPNCTDRSYLYGRLLAIAEKVEKDTFDRDEERETNAMRLQTMFAQRPVSTWTILHQKLAPYFEKMKPAMREYYRRMIQDIYDMMDENEGASNARLQDTYLIGYYHQRKALYTKKTKTEDKGE